ncbi:hypothetical protein IHE49_12395 [Rhodanobacter sp. 7MK24]|uniref:hypothetical protein n=1 Tax=Rhodanobacter sp. 7MK24 TaxID=2775922 RepID=UPI001783E6F3|nr:hypothetical protein [Rhodanobacter sp. 7MK24]MBD8881282.1 hypothetical protein [Rhodanobacter sp. 7MK24]
MIGLVGKRATRWREMPSLLLWVGCALTVVGIAVNGMWSSVPWAPATLLVKLGLAVTLAAWVMKRPTGLSMATSAGLIWLLALIYFAGLASFAAVALLALASVALGSLLIPADWAARGTLSILAGLALIVGVAGWLLPFPVHRRAAYFVVLIAMVLVRWRVVGEVLRPIPQAWRAAVASAPAGMWLAVTAMGIATICAWMPTVHFDDLAGHLALPSQLVSLGYYKMDAASQVWAVTAWASDVLQGVAWLVAGQESRAILDAFWLLTGLVLIWHLCEALDLPPWLRCLAVALYASLPLTAGAVTGMQTEGPTAALTAGIALLIQRSPGPGRRQLLAFSLLFGLLLALKVSNLMVAGPLGLWLLCRWRTRLPWRFLPVALLLLLLVAGSSYTYGWITTGNPVLPVFNGIFHSPYYAPINFHDGHWDSGFHWDIVWNLVFHTSRYIEGGDGTAGFTLVALGGSLLVALLDRRARPLALVALGSFLLPLTQLQYLRYAHQALVLMIPAMLCGLPALAHESRSLPWIAGVLVALVVTNVAFISAGAWQLMGGELGQFLKEPRQDFMESYAPVDRLIDVVNQRYGPHARVLIAAANAPYAAGFAGKAYVIDWYDGELNAKAQQADKDSSGSAWARLLDETGANLLVLQSGHVSTALVSELVAARGELVLQSGDLQLWEVRRAISGSLLPSPSGTINLNFDVAAMPTQAVLAKARVVLGCTHSGEPVALSWTIAREGAEPWSYSEWVNCLPDRTAHATLDVAIPQTVAAFKLIAQPAKAPDMKLSLISADLDARRDLGRQRDLALRMREKLRSVLAAWVDPWTGKGVMHAGLPVRREPAQGVAVDFGTSAAPSVAGIVHATLELGCHYSPTPITVGWKMAVQGDAPDSQYAWMYCGRDGVARASFDARARHRVTSLEVSAVTSEDEGTGLRLLNAQSGYAKASGLRGSINRRRIKLAKWLNRAPEVTRIDP